MRGLSLLGLTLFISGCVASLAEVRERPPEQVGNFAAPAPALAFCVLRAIEAIDSPYAVTFNGGPNQQEFYLTVTRQSLLAQRIIGFELYFVARSQLTQVELREGDRDGHALAQQSWALVGNCAQQAPLPAASVPFH